MSKILARVIHREPLAGRRILEIGCGLGLPSLVAKHLGGDITASDYHPLAQAFLLENTALNALTPIRFHAGNWNTANVNLGQFDFIIGSDILYEREHVQLVSAFINQHASRRVDVVIVDPGRRSHRVFAREMERLGYVHAWTDLREYLIAGAMPKGFIHRFSRHSL